MSRCFICEEHSFCGIDVRPFLDSSPTVEVTTPMKPLVRVVYNLGNFSRDKVRASLSM
jgi:hypothetical protein